jgi:ABC-type antimicrobial peptide transport system permease subunit
VPNPKDNLLLIHPGTASSGGVSFARVNAQTLTLGDAQAIERAGQPAVVRVAPIVRARTQVVHADKNWVPLYIYGTTPAFLEVREWNLHLGRMWTEKDVKARAQVCVLGQTVVRKLFSDETPVGKAVRVNGHSLKVVGTLAPTGANFTGLDQDDILLAPWPIIKDKVNQTGDAPQPVGSTNVDQILVRVRSEEEIPGAIRQITESLRERHQLRAGQADDFTIRNMKEMAKALGH